MILQADPINAMGGINPSWVLTGAVVIMITLLWRMLQTMQKEIKDNNISIAALKIVVSEHHIKHESHVKTLDEHDAEFKRIRDSNSKIADEIVMKLRMAKIITGHE